MVVVKKFIFLPTIIRIYANIIFIVYACAFKYKEKNCANPSLAD